MDAAFIYESTMLFVYKQQPLPPYIQTSHSSSSDARHKVSVRRRRASIDSLMRPNPIASSWMNGRKPRSASSRRDTRRYYWTGSTRDAMRCMAKRRRRRRRRAVYVCTLGRVSVANGQRCTAPRQPIVTVSNLGNERRSRSDRAHGTAWQSTPVRPAERSH